jgi:integrase
LAFEESPLQLRHTFADEWLTQGGAETDLMQIAGWKSRTMLQRDGASTSNSTGRSQAPPERCVELLGST